MSSSDYKELIVSCPSWQKAQALADELLKHNFVTSVECIKAQSQSWYDDVGDGITVIVRTLENDFQTLVAKLDTLQIDPATVTQRVSAPGNVS